MEERAIFPATGPAAQVMSCILPDTPLQSALKIVSSLRAVGSAYDLVYHIDEASEMVIYYCHS